MRRKAGFGFMDPKVIMSVVVSLIILVVGVLAVATVTTQTDDFSRTINIETTTTTYDEQYTDDDNDTNPTEDWYSYYESGLPYANVTNLTTENSFRMNTTVGSDTTGGALYNFTTEDDYETLETVFRIDASLHNYTTVTVGSWIDSLSDDGAIAYWNITTDYVAFYVLTTGTGTYTEVWNNTIDNMTWYKLEATLNYDDYSINGELYNVSSSTTMNSSAETCVYEFTNITQSFWAITDGHGEDSCYIWFDSFTLTDTDTTDGEEPVDVMETANSVFGIVGIVLIVSAIMAIIGLMYPYLRS